MKSESLQNVFIGIFLLGIFCIIGGMLTSGPSLISDDNILIKIGLTQFGVGVLGSLFLNGENNF